MYGPHLEYCRHGQRQILQSVGGNGCTELHVCPVGEEGHCRPTRSVLPFIHMSIFETFAKPADLLPFRPTRETRDEGLKRTVRSTSGRSYQHHSHGANLRPGYTL